MNVSTYRIIVISLYTCTQDYEHTFYHLTLGDDSNGCDFILGLNPQSWQNLIGMWRCTEKESQFTCSSQVRGHPALRVLVKLCLPPNMFLAMYQICFWQCIKYETICAFKFMHIYTHIFIDTTSSSTIYDIPITIVIIIIMK